jgi:hypothetical protein
MNMFNAFTKYVKDNTISKKVMEVVEKRVEAAQAKYDDGCIDIDQDANGRIAEIEIKRDKSKDELAEDLANEVLGGKK